MTTYEKADVNPDISVTLPAQTAQQTNGIDTG